MTDDRTSQGGTAADEPEAAAAASPEGGATNDGGDGTSTAGASGAEGVFGNGEVQELEAERSELAQLQGEIEALNDRHLRLAAEFDNYRRRVERERLEQHNRSQAALAGRLLDALDDLQRVEHIDPATATVESLLQALDLVERKFRQALEAAGLEEIAAAGEIFDPRTMEAVMTAPAESEAEDDVVADVLRKGYRFGNTLVRPAQVRVKKFGG